MQIHIWNWREIKFILHEFEENLRLGSKYSNYLDFKQAMEIIVNKEHLNKEGLEKILFLKNKFKYKLFALRQQLQFTFYIFIITK